MSSSSTRTTTLASTGQYGYVENNKNYNLLGSQQPRQPYFTTANGKGPPTTTTSLSTLDNNINKFHTNIGYASNQQHPQAFLHVQPHKPSQQQQRLSGCAQCLRWLVFMLNFLFWLAGFVLLSFAIWLRYDPALKTYMDLDEQVDHYYGAAYLLMAAGAITAFIGFVGCCGAVRKSTCLLATFIMILIIIFGTELAAGTVAYLRLMDLRPFMEQQMRAIIRNQYAQPQYSLSTRYIDLLQTHLHCCGAVSPMDWHESIYGGPIIITAAAAQQQSLTRDLGVLGAAEFYLPSSCCTPAFRVLSLRTHECMQIPPSMRAAAARRRLQVLNSTTKSHADLENEESVMLRNFTGMEVSFTQTDFINGGGGAGGVGGGVDGISSRFYRLGCVDRLAEQLDLHLQAICAVAFGLAMLQLLGLVFTTVLMCALKAELQNSNDVLDGAHDGDVIFAVHEHPQTLMKHSHQIPTTFIAAPMMINDRSSIYAVPPSQLIQLHAATAMQPISVTRPSATSSAGAAYSSSSRNRESLAESSGGRSSSSAAPGGVAVIKSNTISYHHGPPPSTTPAAAVYGSRPPSMLTGYATTARRAPSVQQQQQQHHGGRDGSGDEVVDYRRVYRQPPTEDNYSSASAYYGIATRNGPNGQNLIYSSSTLATSHNNNNNTTRQQQQQQQLFRQPVIDQQQPRFMPQYHRNEKQQLFSHSHPKHQRQLQMEDEKLHRL